MQGTLRPTEPHPAVFGARDYISRIPTATLFQFQEAFATCAIEGNRLGEICGETLRRLLSGEPVSDRYLLGLAWVLKDRVVDLQEDTAELDAQDAQSALEGFPEEY